jgi:hypothetical protein
MKLITPMTDLQTGRHNYAVWEYDESKPRNLEADDPRQRYAVKRFVGSFKTLTEANGA